MDGVESLLECGLLGATVCFLLCADVFEKGENGVSGVFRPECVESWGGREGWPEREHVE